MAGKKTKQERNPWKIVSVVFIILFISILAFGVMALRNKPVFAQLTQEQITLAEEVVAQDLESRGDSIDNYDVSVTNKPVGFFERHHKSNGAACLKPVMHGKEECSLGRNVQVSLKGNSSIYLYIVDLDSERVVMRSFTEWFD